MNDGERVKITEDNNKQEDHPDKNPTEENPNRPSYWKLLFFFSNKIDKLFTIFALIGSIGAGISMPIFAMIFGSTINVFNNSNVINSAVISQQVGTMAKNYLYAGVGIFVSCIIMVTFWTLTGKRLILKMKEEYFKLILKQEQGWFDQKNPFEFSTKVQSQTKTIENGLGDKVGNFLMSLSMFIASFIVGFTTSWKLSLVLTAMLPLLGVGGFLVTYLMQSSTKESREAYEKAGGIAEEVLYSIKTVASFSNFKYEVERYNEYLIKSMNAGIKGGFKTGFGICFIFLSVYSSYALAVWYGSVLILDNEYNDNFKRNFSAGDVITVLFSIIFGCFALGQAAPNLFAMSDACNSATDLFTLVNRIPIIFVSDINEKPGKETLKGKLDFENVKFSYPSRPDNLIIKGLSFDFEPGKKIAIVGESGSGKSTIISLVLRLYDLNEGQILFDGKNIKDFEINHLRGLIGYVPQEPVLFNKSIKENIIFGRENITDEMIYEACEKAHANEFISKIDEKLDYVVGIKGNKLSGGQKQRIAIARAILLKPKILLLDEATSALDNKSEKEVQKALDLVSQEVTTIVVAHRLTTIINSDNILVLNKGELVESGNHEELMKREGIYAGLVKSQLENKNEKNKEEEHENNNLSNESILDNKDIELKFHHEKKASINENSKEELSKSQQNEGLNRINMEKEVVSDKKPRKNSANQKNQELKNLNDEEDPVVNEYFKSSRKRLIYLLSDFKCVVIVGAFFASCSGCVWPCYGILLGDAINILLNNVSGGFIAGMFLVLAGSASVAAFFQHHCFTEMGEVLAWKLRKQVFEKYLSLHIGYFDKKENSPGSLLTKLSSDTAKVNGVAMSILGISMQTLMNLLLGLLLGFISEWRLTLINIAFLPIVAGETIIRLQVQKGFMKNDEEIEVDAGAILSESVINTKTIFSYNMQDKVVEMYREILSQKNDNIVKSSLIGGILYGFSQFLIFCVYATLFYAGGQFIGNNSINDGRTSMFRAIFVLLFAAFGIGQAQAYIQDYGGSRAAVINLYKTLDEESKINPSQNESEKTLIVEGKIEFRNVFFSYPTRSDEIVLKNVSFTINPGEKVAFVGFSGSGKSTIIQLLERFYDCSTGEILVDDQDIRTLDLIQYRRSVGLVMQEPVLFSDTIVNNIRYGRLEATHEEIVQAARDAFIEKYVTNENKEHNMPISGGEKQRVAIARAILKKPKILLLDEATSALDKNSEEIVQKALDQLMEGRTSVVVAHRLSTIANCDRIFVLEFGVIVESGKHEELLEKKGKYYNLYMGIK